MNDRTKPRLATVVDLQYKSHQPLCVVDT